MKNNKNVFPEKGLEPGDVLAMIHEKKSGDRSWENGSMFGYVYAPEPEIAEAIKKVSQLYFFENVINSSHFPSIVYFENQVIAAVKELLHGNGDVCGNITSGGTESIFLALKASRDWSLKNRPSVEKPEIILAASVHPAFYKAAHCLGIKTVTLPLDDEYRADLSYLPACVSGNSIMVALSAPCYPYGVVDPIEEAGRFCLKNGLFLHVDACLGGFMLPFMEIAGYPVPSFDFRIEGVTSVSADLHKYGYGAKGSSIILYRNRELRREQFFVNTTWPGGLFGTPTLLGSRSGAPIVIAWALLKLLGKEGYLRMTINTIEVVHKLKEGIQKIKGLHLVGDPAMSVFAFSSDRNDIFQIGDAMYERGWSLDRIKHPEALHLVVTNLNLETADAFLRDLEDIVTARHNIKKNSFATGLAKKAAGALIRAFPGNAQALFSSMAANAVKRDSPQKQNRGAVFYGISSVFESKTDMDKAVVEFLEKLYS